MLLLRKCSHYFLVHTHKTRLRCEAKVTLSKRSMSVQSGRIESSDPLMFRFDHHHNAPFEVMAEGQSARSAAAKAPASSLLTDLLVLQHSISLIAPPESAAAVTDWNDVSGHEGATGNGHGILACGSLLERVMVPRVRRAIASDVGKQAAQRLRATATTVTPDEILAAVSGKAAPFSTARATAILQQNAKRPFSQCVSTLTSAQHLQYRGWILQYQTAGRRPPASILDKDLPSWNIVLETVEKEQSSYLKKLRDMIVQCELCVKPHIDASQSPHECQNHNFVFPEAVEWYREVIVKKHNAELEALLKNDGGANMNIKKSVRSVMMVLSKAILQEQDSSSSMGGSKPSVLSASVVPSPTPRLLLASSSEDEPQRTRGPRRESSDALPLKTRVFGGAVIPSMHRLPVHELLAATSDERRQVDELAAYNDWVAKNISPSSSSSSSSIILTISASALLAVATSHVASFRSGFALPVVVTSNENSVVAELVVHVLKPLRECDGMTSRKHVVSSAFKRLVAKEISNIRQARRTSTAGPAAAGVVDNEDEVECVALSELSLPEASHPKGARVFLRCRCFSSVGGNEDEQSTRVYFLVKTEYNHKGYNLTPEDPATFRLEAFSCDEVIRMMILFNCIPNLTIRVHRVCAYTQCVLAVEQITKMIFTSSVLPLYTHTQQIRVVWQVVNAFISNLMHHISDLPSTPPSSQVLVVRKARGDRDFVIGPLQASGTANNDASGGGPVVSVAELANGRSGELRLEPAPSAEVCKREYNPPCVWPHRDRVPFTFEPSKDGGTAADGSEKWTHSSVKFDYEFCLLK